MQGKDSAGTHASPPRASFWQKLGPGGFSSLVLAFLVGLLALGIPVLLCLRRVLRAAKGGVLQPSDAILVLGRKLEEDRPTPVFSARLEHAARLWEEGWAPRVVVAGGLTGRATRTEAEAGRTWLLERGLPIHAVAVEDRSQNTLENLFNVREDFHGFRLILVSDPLHLGRATAFAQGLGLKVCGSPAPACPRNAWGLRAVREAFLLHWYRTGLAYSRLIRSKRQLARVT